jgi:hypothetical protein
VLRYLLVFDDDILDVLEQLELLSALDEELGLIVPLEDIDDLVQRHNDELVVLDCRFNESIGMRWMGVLHWAIELRLRSEQGFIAVLESTADVVDEIGEVELLLPAFDARGQTILEGDHTRQPLHHLELHLAELTLEQIEETLCHDQVHDQVDELEFEVASWHDTTEIHHLREVASLQDLIETKTRPLLATVTDVFLVLREILVANTSLMVPFGYDQLDNRYCMIRIAPSRRSSWRLMNGKCSTLPAAGGQGSRCSGSRYRLSLPPPRICYQDRHCSSGTGSRRSSESPSTCPPQPSVPFCSISPSLTVELVQELQLASTTVAIHTRRCSTA